MGLFDKKEPCAICGGKVSALFPWKVEGQLVCNSCYGQVDLPEETMKYMTLEGFKEYRAFREENELLKQRFQTTRQVDFGWLDDKFLFDAGNRLLCMDKKLRKPVFEGEQVKSFEIREDQLPLFSGSAQGLVRYASTVPDRVMAMGPQIEMLKVQVQMREDMERMMDNMKDDDDDSGRRYCSFSSIAMPLPFQRFHVEIQLEHPYFPVYETDRKAPEFDSTNPDIYDYLEHYNQDVQLMEELARGLMEVAFPGALERTVASASPMAASNGPVSAPGVAVDAVEELKRLKGLMDMGILTEEEFTAKKRQLLGI